MPFCICCNICLEMGNPAVTPAICCGTTADVGVSVEGVNLPGFTNTVDGFIVLITAPLINP